MKKFGRLMSTDRYPHPGPGRYGGVGPVRHGAGRRGRGGGAGDSYSRMYNPKTVETLSGEVVSLEKTAFGRRGRSLGVHFTCRPPRDDPGPPGAQLVSGETRPDLVSGDKVEVTGSRVTYQGQPAIIAAEVKKGGQVLKLRDAAGVPAWAGQGRRNR